MGGPMWWGRMMGRNGLAQLGPEPYSDGYIKEKRPRDPTADLTIRKGLMAGELWRMRHDYFERVAGLAEVCGISKGEAERVLRAVFTEPEPDCADCQAKVDAWARGIRQGGSGWAAGRCGRHEFIYKASDT